MQTAKFTSQLFRCKVRSGPRIILLFQRKMDDEKAVSTTTRSTKLCFLLQDRRKVRSLVWPSVAARARAFAPWRKEAMSRLKWISRQVIKTIERNGSVHTKKSRVWHFLKQDKELYSGRCVVCRWICDQSHERGARHHRRHPCAVPAGQPQRLQRLRPHLPLEERRSSQVQNCHLRQDRVSIGEDWIVSHRLNWFLWKIVRESVRSLRL